MEKWKKNFANRASVFFQRLINRTEIDWFSAFSLPELYISPDITLIAFILYKVCNKSNDGSYVGNSYRNDWTSSNIYHTAKKKFSLSVF